MKFISSFSTLNKNTNNTIILGIDPGLCITGYGILIKNNYELKYLSSGCIRTKVDYLPNRLKTIYTGVSNIINKFKPNCLAIEQVFIAKNYNSILKLSQARGVAIVAAINLNLPVFEYSVKKIKKMITGTGSAEKSQVQKNVSLILKLINKPQADAADALAAAITHCYVIDNI